MADAAPGPLAGIRICDLTGQLAGAGATRLLASFGAEVIRVEDPVTNGAWDLLRTAGPFPGGIRGRDTSVSFNNHNVGKLGVTINLRDDRGRRLLRELIEVSDALTENFASGIFARLGFPYETIRDIRPDIIYVSNSGFGSSGPYAKYKTWGPIVQAFCGLTYTSRLPGQPPAGWGYSYMDHLGAYYMAMAVLAALLHRDRTGEGQWIDMACTEAGTTLLGPLLLDYTVNGRSTDDDPAWSSNRGRFPAMAPHGIYPSRDADRWVAIACRDDAEWIRLREAVGDGWAQEPRWEGVSGRVADWDQIDQHVGEWTAGFPVSDLVGLLAAAGVTASVVASPQERIDLDPAAKAWNLWPEVEHTELGCVRVDGIPVHFSETDWRIEKGAPCLGEDNERIFGHLLGREPAELEQLAAEGVI